MKEKARRILSGTLSLVMVLSGTVCRTPSLGAEPETEPETAVYEAEYPPLEKVEDLLSEGEIVKAEDYTVETGSGFDAEHDFSGMEIDPEKVTVTFYEAKSEEGEEFDADREGIYKAVYFVEPASGNPKYHVIRNLTVQDAGPREETAADESEPDTGACPDDGGTDLAETEDRPSEDGQDMEKSMLPVLENPAEISAAEMPEGVQEQNPESVRAEFSMLPAVSGQTELETGEEPGTEAADRGDAAGEPETGAEPGTEAADRKDAAGEPETGTEPGTEAADRKDAAEEPETGTEPGTEAADRKDAAEEPETGTEPGTEAADRKDAAEEPETGAEPGTEETAETDPAEEPETETENVTEAAEEKEGEYQVNIIRGEELGVVLDHEDGKYHAGDTVLFSTGLPEGSLTAVGAMKTAANAQGNTADLLYSEVTYHADTDMFSFEMPEDDIDLEVAQDHAQGDVLAIASSGDDDVPWDEATEIEANTYYYYSDGKVHPFDSVMGSGGNDSYKYVRYKVGGKTYTVYAYCMQHSMPSPPSGTTYKNMIELDEGGDDKYLRKALFYGYGGPGWGKTFNGYNLSFTVLMSERPCIACK